MTLLEEFNFLFPEFKNPPVTDPPVPPVEDERIQYWLTWAENWLCPNAWGSNFREAILLLAAIRLAMWQKAQQDGSIGTPVMGPVTAAAVGGESVGYSRRGNAYLSLTDEMLYQYPPYGPSFIALRESSISGIKTTFTGYNWWEMRGC